MADPGGGAQQAPPPPPLLRPPFFSPNTEKSPKIYQKNLGSSPQNPGRPLFSDPGSATESPLSPVTPCAHLYMDNQTLGVSDKNGKLHTLLAHKYLIGT